MNQPPRPLSVLHLVPDLHPRSGGPSRAVVQWCDSLAQEPGTRVTVMSQSIVGEPVIRPRAATERVARTGSRWALRFGLPARRSLSRFEPDAVPDVLHSHGLWMPVGHWAASAASRYRIPLAVSPHGMLEPWALRHHARRKQAAMALFQRRDLQSAKVLFATSEAECLQLRRLGLRPPVAVLPNGIALEAGCDPEPRRAGSAPRVALFLSRIHPKKGLLKLVRAWSLVAPEGWRLQIAGPNENGHLAEVLALADALGVRPSIDVVGEVDDVRKIAVYRSADLFVLPTFSENFGIVVAEALSQGVPVITTRGAPWADLETHGCGWWIDIGAEPLAVALREATRLSDAERHAMGMRGRAYVQRYDWRDIAAATTAVYRWLLGGGPRPACVWAD